MGLGGENRHVSLADPTLKEQDPRSQLLFFPSKLHVLPTLCRIGQGQYQCLGMARQRHPSAREVRVGSRPRGSRPG